MQNRNKVKEGNVMLAGEMKEHLRNVIIPFWEGLKDNDNDGYYGWVGYDLKVDKKAVKGCILNSRIVWFFSNAYKILKDEKLLEDARHGFEFMKRYCMDKKYGGIFWSIRYDGEPEETIKHTYNQAFAIYALSSYYDASGDKEALDMAFELFRIIEEKCTDETGYLECFSRAFEEIENDKLSENGVIADKTMNTLLHVLEAYTELYRVSGDAAVKNKLKWILDTFADKVYNPPLHRQEVFFDAEMNTILDLHSYGHDIETAWLVDRALAVLDDDDYTKKLRPVTKDLTAQIYQTAFDGHSLANECEKGVVDETRVWWVQAETVVGFLNGYEQDSSKKEYLDAAKNVWEFIKEYVVDKRSGSEWYWKVDKEGKPIGEEPIVEPWKCPYHNGRMCFEVIRRSENVPEFA
jgi:N-acyl-D-glucosamine 2-epimerase